MAIQIKQPFEMFFNKDGSPLNDGNVYIGIAGLNPETNPISIFSDPSMTIPVAQPLKTINGYISSNGNATDIYVLGDYSITVKDKNGLLMYHSLINDTDNTIIGTIASLRLTPYVGQQIISVTGYYTAADNIGVREYYWDATSTESDNGGTIIQVTGVVTGRWKMKYSGAVNVKWFGAVGDGVTDDIVAIKYVLENFNVVYIPRGTFIANGSIILKDRITVHGDGRESTFLVSNTITSFLSLIGNSNYLFGIYVRADLGTALLLTSNNGQEGVYENCTFKGAIGVRMEGTWNTKWIGCRFRGVGAGTSFKAFKNGTGNNYDTVFTGCAFLGDSSAGSALADLSTGGFTLDGCDLEGASLGFTSTQAGPIDYIHVNNCHFENLPTVSNISLTSITGSIIVLTGIFSSTATAIKEFANNVLSYSVGLIPFKNVAINRFYGNHVYNSGTARPVSLVKTTYQSAPFSTINLVKTLKRTGGGVLYGFGGYNQLPTITTVDSNMLGSVATLTGIGASTNGIVTNINGSHHLVKFLISEHTGANINIGFELRRRSDNTVVGGYSCSLQANDTGGVVDFYEVLCTLRQDVTYETYSKIYISWENAIPTTFKIANFSVSDEAKFGINTLPDDAFKDTVIPSGSGAWKQGEIVYNSAPVAAGFLGWVCTTAGTPGTWKTFGAITA